MQKKISDLNVKILYGFSFKSLRKKNPKNPSKCRLLNSLTKPFKCTVKQNLFWLKFLTSTCTVFICRYSVVFLCLWNFFIISQMLPWSERQTTAWAHYQRHCSKPQLKIECVRVWNRSRIIVSPQVQAVFKGEGGPKMYVNLEVWPLPAQDGGYLGNVLYAGQMTNYYPLHLGPSKGTELS